MVRALARAAFFGSGVAGLTFEIVWIRYLGLSVGATTLAIATITAAYMGGLALGSHLGGKLADRLRRPVAIYGALELSLALVGLAVPALCRMVPVVDAALLDEASSGLARALIRFAVSVLVLIVPTTLMGATLPILARAVTAKVEDVGREVGVLYAINIAGAMAGAALSGFVWIPAMGLNHTNYVAVGIDVLVGVVALAVGLAARPRDAGPLASNEDVAPASGTEAAVSTLGLRIRPGAAGLVVLLALTGAAAMALQVLWSRALSTALGPSTYAFSAIVCAYLAGLALGGALASRLAGRVRSIHFALAAVLLGTGAATLFGIAVVDDLPTLLRGIVLDPTLTVGGWVRTEFGLAALSLLPATIGMGAVFPLTVSSVVASEARLGEAVGIAYAVNTVGAILGSFAGVFVLLPVFGVEMGMRVAALAYAAAGLALALRIEPEVPVLWRRGAAMAALVLALALAAWPRWNIAQWTSGIYRISMTRAFFDGEELELAQVVFHGDGLSSTVTVEQEDDVIWIKVGGKVDGSSVGDMSTQVLSGLLPMLFHPSPNEVAVIGCGTGVTVGSATQGGAERVTLIELEPEVLEGAKLFAKVNHAFWEDPHVRIVTDDGRNFLRRTTAPFDVIISEPSNPWMTGAASLFTREFFELASTRLAKGGLFLQWLQVYELAPERIQSVLKTFHSVFPNVWVFTPSVDSNDLLLLGSREPLPVDLERLRDRFRAAAPELARAELWSPEDVLALLLSTSEQLDQISADIPLNTDDNALIEFGAPRDLLLYADRDAELPVLTELAGRKAELFEARLGVSREAWPETAHALARSFLAVGMVDDARAALVRVPSDLAETKPALAAEMKGLAEIAHLLSEEDNVSVVDEALLDRDSEYSALAAMLARGEVPLARKRFDSDAKLRTRTNAHALMYGFLLYQEGEYEEARTVLTDAAADAATALPATAYYLAREAYQQGEYRRAVSQMEAYRVARDQSLSRSQGRD